MSNWTISDYTEQTTNYVSEPVAALFQSQTCVLQPFIVSLDVILSASRSQEDHMEAEILTHTHTAGRPHGALGHCEILHPESTFIKNTLPKPPFITQACAFSPSGVDLSET